MSCQEWELRLAADEIGPEVEAHLAGCPACRALAEDLAANSETMLALGEEVMPPVVLPRRAPSPWRWAAAVAAMLVAGVGMWQVWGPVRTPVETVTVRAPLLGAPKVESALPVVAQSGPAGRPAARKTSWQLVAFRENAKDEALLRMVTSDPNVVIYWLIEPEKEDGE